MMPSQHEIGQMCLKALRNNRVMNHYSLLDTLYRPEFGVMGALSCRLRKWEKDAQLAGLIKIQPNPDNCLQNFSLAR